MELIARTPFLFIVICLQPSNLSKDLPIYIFSDFGSAIQYYGNADDAISPKFVGTMKYCPPEAITQGKFRALGGDIWAMGILLYTLFHGGNPFYDANEILNARLEIDEQ